MDWQAALRARLLAASDVTDLVGTRVTWVDRPQSSALPAITLTTITDQRPQSLRGFETLQPARVQVDCWSNKHSEANALAEAAIATLTPANQTGGVTFSRGFPDIKRDLGEQIDTKFVHRTQVDMIINRSTA